MSSTLKYLESVLSKEELLLSRTEKEILSRNFFFNNTLLTVEEAITQIEKYESDLIAKITQFSNLQGRIVIIYNLFNNVLVNNDIRNRAKKILDNLDNLIKDAISDLKKVTGYGDIGFTRQTNILKGDKIEPKKEDTIKLTFLQGAK